MTNIPFAVRSNALIKSTVEIREPEELYKAVVDLTGDVELATKWQLDLVMAREKDDIESG